MSARLIEQADWSDLKPTLAHSASVSSTSPIGKIELFESFADVADSWRAFETTATCTPYQRYDWLRIWQDHIGAAEDVRPVLCQVKDPSGRLLAILPFGRYRHGGFRVASWLGDKHMNYFMGLYAPGDAVLEIDWRPVLKWIARHSDIDVFFLKNQPRTWHGRPNPMASLPSHPSPSQAYSTALDPDFETFLESRRPGRWKRLLRNKERKLALEGNITVARFVNCDEASAVLETYFNQKARRLSEHGIPNPFDPPYVRAFFKDVVCSQDRDDPLLELYALYCDNDILAVYAGSGLQNRFSTSICSITDSPLNRYSPGEQLLKALIADRCARGDTMLDLGIGESRYKRHWCPDTDDLFDTLVPVTAAGHVAKHLAIMARRAKRAIKQNERAWSVYSALRSLKAGKPWHPNET